MEGVVVGCCGSVGVCCVNEEEAGKQTGRRPVFITGAALANSGQLFNFFLAKNISRAGLQGCLCT